MQLSFHNMSKAYGGVPALSDVSLSLMGGRVHALMGENGAGKSTLIRLIAGVTTADSLAVERDGAPVPLASAQDAHRAGFRVIHQELNIIPQVSVAENILLGLNMPRRFGFTVDWRRLRGAARKALAELGVNHIDVTAPAGSLPPDDRMLIKIASALVADEGAEAVLYVLDEPTAALTGAESERLFKVIAQLKARGAAVLYVSHRLDEVLRICDEVTVLRDGRHISTTAVAETSKEEIIQAMTGREVLDTYPPRTTALPDTGIATLSGVSAGRLSGLDVTLRAGEILGVSGLADAGQSELLRLFLGQLRITRGTAELNDRALPRSAADAWAQDVAYIPRERRAEALMLDLAIRANIVLPHLGGYGWRARSRSETRDARALAKRVRLKSEGVGQPVRQLSGGNQQKVVFARALMGAPKLLLLDEPTRGVDVGAKYDIYTLVRALSAQGCAVLLTSSDLPETLGMCDRILVLQNGRQTHLLDRAGLTSADLLRHCYPEAA